jgi:multidrug efflux pump subunit AcrA (membrane-fusion protein)
MNRLFAHFSITLLCAMTAVVSIGCNRSKSDAGEKTAAAHSGNPGVVEVPAVRAVNRRIPVVVQATGSFLADEAADVASEADGIVVETPVDVGRFVKKGDVLFRLDDRTAKLRLEQAEAALRQAEARLGLKEGVSFHENAVADVAAARANYEAVLSQANLAQSDAGRYTSLYKSGDVSKSTFDSVQTRAKTAQEQASAALKLHEAALNAARQGYNAVEGARAQVALARKTLEDTVIKAPFAGHVTARNVAVGEYIGAMNRANKIVRLVRIDPIKLRLQVPEVEAAKLRVGMNTTATVQAHSDKRFEGRLTAINPAVDPGSRAITVEASIHNPAGLVLPGMFAAGQIEQPAAEDAVYAPRAAILHDPNTDSYRVYVVEGQVARLRVVQLGKGREGELVQIATGVAAGALLAVGKLDRLYDGAPVRATTGA